MFFRYNLFGIVWALIIAVLTLTPGGEMVELNIWGKADIFTFAHVGFFAILVFLLCIGFTKQYTFKEIKERPEKFAVVFGVIFGFILEFIQAVIPNRSLEVIDLIANSIGCLTGYFIFFLVYKAGINLS
ncbi:VanZ family protein [Mangrovivirga sp. M17]|uniref:VanZ family protein n=1 Tax=Mangrovivirga halotolerans TaxID=2993936 RepID=A0ABT3RM50_9BACT|nr:VanZ family protein [Mangrovivirga halotolerans]MCX2742886.1 VanZ family protein [Mangrovivirga halotolerans]